MGVKLKDIAEKTGYSINTVSMVVNGKGRISEATRKVIKDCIKEMGYVTNGSARSLRSGKSNMLALIVDDLINPWLSAISDEIIVYSGQLGYTVNVYITNGEVTKETDAVSDAIGREADGIILLPIQQNNESVKLMYRHNIPFVLLGRTVSEFSDDLSVTYDELRCGYIAVEHLLLKGHNSIMVMNSEKNSYTGESRLNGIEAAFYTYGKKIDSNMICNLPINVHSRRKQIRNVMKQMEKCTAVVCYDDMVALEVIDYLKKEGKSVPGDVSVIGFGNIGKNIPVTPKLTTIDSSENKLPITAVDLLIEKINGKNPVKKVLTVMIFEGDTVADLNLY